MQVGLFRLVAVYVLVLLAGAIHTLESKFCDLCTKALLVSLICLFGIVLRVEFEAVVDGVANDGNLLVWYKKLPQDFYSAASQENSRTLESFLLTQKPKPPVKLAEIQTPAVSAKSYVVMDVVSGTVLSEKNPDEVFPPASTAKIATALAALALYDLDEEIAIPQFCTQVDGNKIGFSQGLRFRVEVILQALLVASAGDAACTLSVSRVSYADFVAKMNFVVKEGGLARTKFTNPIGLDDADGENLSSARDLAKLAILAMHNDFFRETVKLKELELRDLDGKFAKQLTNTNRLLWDIPESVGIKTGTTTGAGEVLVYEYTKDKADLIIVAMGSKDRFADVKLLLDWALLSHSWE